MKRVFVLGAILLVVICTVAAVIFLIRIDGTTLYERAYAVHALRDITFIKSGPEDTGLYSFSFLGLKQKTVPHIPGSVTGYARAGETEAVIAQTESGAQEVYLLSGEQKALTATEVPKASLALSPTGNFLTYSSAASSEGASLLSSWTIHLHNVHTGTEIELGPGYGGQFVERDGKEFLLYTTKDAIIFIATDDLSGFSTLSQIQDDVSFAVVVSPDGKYLASRDMARRAWNLYTVKTFAEGLPLSLSPLPLDISMLDAVHLTNTELVGIEPIWSITDESRDLVGGTVMQVALQDINELKSLYKFSGTSIFMFTK